MTGLMEYTFAWVERGSGNEPKGGNWEKFLEDQESALDEYAVDGWSLVSVVPINGAGSAGAAASSRTVGMMFYFEREKSV